MNKHEARMAAGSITVLLLSLIVAGVAVLTQAPIVIGTSLGGVVLIYVMGYIVNDIILEE